MLLRHGDKLILRRGLDYFNALIIILLLKSYCMVIASVGFLLCVYVCVSDVNYYFNTVRV